MKRAKYCILNVQYSKEEYDELAPKIIEQMRLSEEWGELFPMSRSPFGYNETMANDYFPLSEEEIRGHGWPYKSHPFAEKDGIPASDLPDNINDIDDGMLQRPVFCTRTGRVFRITPQELEFYRTHRLPLPRLHPDERHRDRFNSHNPPHVYSRNCVKCSKDIQTTYAPERPEIVYCDQCYLDAAY